MITAAKGPVQTVPDVCPYCGGDSFVGSRCQHCRGLVDPLSLQASQNDMGPWFIRSIQAPFRPGCSYRMLVQQVLKSRLDLDSVLRGPTTRQFWMKASRTPGISHLLGVCHSCGTAVAPESDSCPACHASFVVDTPRQHLGLGPVFLVPGQAGGEAVVVAGKKLPPIVADSVDFEPLHLDDPPSTRPLATPTASAPSPPKPRSLILGILLMWALLATLGTGIILADSWFDLKIGLTRQSASK